MRRIDAHPGPLRRKLVQQLLEVIGLPAEKVRKRGLHNELETSVAAPFPHRRERLGASCQTRFPLPHPIVLLSARVNHVEAAFEDLQGIGGPRQDIVRASLRAVS